MRTNKLTEDTSRPRGRSLEAITIPAQSLTIDRTQRLGQGGFGVVYKGAWHFEPVAVKELHTQVSDRAKQDLIREARTMAGLRSGRVVPFKGLCMEKQPYRLVMQYMAGGSLYALLHSNKPLGMGQQYRIAADVALGLHFLHRQRIVHQDLKSHNVLLDEHGRAYLGDFGLATIKREVSSTTTKAGAGSGGTLLWMAPELLEPGAKATPASDMYSYAMTLWELVSRQVPWSDAQNPHVAVNWVMQGEREGIPNDAPKLLAQLIAACWVPEPTKRLTAKDVIPQLQQALKATPPTAGSHLTPARATGDEKRRPPVSGPQWAAATASGAVYDHASGEKSHRRQPGGATGPISPSGDEKTRVHPDQAEAIAALQRELEQLKAQVKQSLPHPQSVTKPGTSPRLFQAPTVDPKQLQTLLNHVARAQQDDVEALLKKLKPEQARALLNAKGTVTDYSERTFKDITAFQYALWAMDPFTWRVILQYLPKEDARVQLEAHEKQGTEHGTYFSLEPLLKAYKVTDTESQRPATIEKPGKFFGTKTVANPARWTRDRLNDYWVSEVGGQQRNLPAHMMREYLTHDRPLDPVPDFGAERPPVDHPYCGLSWVWSAVHPAHRGKSGGLGLGAECAIARGGSPYVCPTGWANHPHIDLAAFSTLSGVRTQQMAELRSSLLGTAQPARRTSPGNR